ncbi:MBL fold metallo-hydrolase [Pseudothauera lacus]|uniref:MBL fold metallo-hydrolase n=1 Tax=Pseudothauera lacus TaxID=2136175 RepID=A0A2T4IFF7_9RHOO|nr:MBL fold metallo-hydrolase [Pseudothauera lacus]PTD96520.1 MBL fold metallo-hydrolase [Pseudothauera lacus]
MALHRLATLLCALVMLPSAALASDESILHAEEVAPGIHALIGPTGARTFDNHALNANYGVIDTADGTILIDSGASRSAAGVLERQAVALTGKPVRWVINTGAQDHRWLGNDHFRARGVEVIAMQRTVATQRAVAAEQLDALRPVLGERLAGTTPAYASQMLGDDHSTLELGGRRIEIHYFADAHFPGDMVVWLPAEGIAFAGDHVYVDRLLGVRPRSNPESWLAAFEGLKGLQPRIIVPGHGNVTDLATAEAQTGAYLAFLVEHVKVLAEEMAGVDAAVAALAAAPQFEHLANFAELHRLNINRAYLHFESAP